ncbi:cytochrome P450 [Aspergillus stella-maris]|uniref:cytochrome P450 n=1 Tax=Aspergillus stella-maris TaxID=1810926 RepID=UPI003CCC972C
MAVAGDMHLSYLATRAYYNIYLHPLAKFPGPKIWAAVRLMWAWSYTSGSNHSRIKRLHGQYGPVVRVAPDELSFIDARAWNDIYAKGPGNKGLERSKVLRNAQPVDVVFNSNGEDHTRVRRKLLQSFSEQPLVKQEPILQEYVTKVMNGLRRASEAGETVDLVEWFNWFSFDVFGELAFSESFEQLEKEESHYWVKLLDSYLKGTMIGICLGHYPPIMQIARLLAPSVINRLVEQLTSPVRDKINRRIKRCDHENLEDAMASLLPQSNDNNTIPDPETFTSSIALLILAGSETVATTLAAITNALTSDQRMMQKLCEEVKSAPSRQELTLSILAQMPYLNAVIKEGLRLCHPVPSYLARVTPPEGKIIAGHFVPGNTQVGIPYFAIYTSESNFVHAERFWPERWLATNPPDESSNVVFQPFMVGGHSCPGQVLARAELRLVLARLLYEFDIEALSRFCWDEQESYLMWKKRAFAVRLRALKREG